MSIVASFTDLASVDTTATSMTTKSVVDRTTSAKSR